MISFIGMILGLLLFVVLAFKGFNLILSAVASSCLMFVFSGIGFRRLKRILFAGTGRFFSKLFPPVFLKCPYGKADE